MSDDEKRLKLLAQIKVSQRGWRKVQATAAGSYSRKLAGENLRRLDALRTTLLSQANMAELDGSARRTLLE